MKRLHAARNAMITCVIAGLLVMGITGIIASAKTKPKLNRKNLELKVGEKKKLQIKNTKKKVKWISNNKKIATVTQRGLWKKDWKNKDHRTCSEEKVCVQSDSKTETVAADQ